MDDFDLFEFLGCVWRLVEIQALTAKIEADTRRLTRLWWSAW